MKKTIVLVLISCLTVLSCKNNQKTEDTSVPEAESKIQNNDKDILKGHFILYDGAAVLQTDDIIYGVLLTDKAYELEEKAKAYQTEPTDMVLVEVKGKISTKSHDKIRWPYKLEITEIISVSAAEKG